MTDAVNAVVARFFSVMLGETLFSSVMADNPASLKLQGQIGLRRHRYSRMFTLTRVRKCVNLITTEVTFGGYMPM